MATENTPVLEKEDSLSNFASASGAPNTFMGVDNTDELKNLYKGSDGKTRKGLVGSRHLQDGSVEEYVDNETTEKINRSGNLDRMQKKHLKAWENKKKLN